MTNGGNRWSWAAYLGASWTWCIGMFLPVLLVRDYGPWAWLIFAVPNVVGAAAMGWTMRTAAASRKYTHDHASACRLFSFVTIAFQLYFAMWMLPRLVGPIGYVVAAVIVQSAFTPVTKSRSLRFGGAAVLAISLALAGGMYGEGALHWPPHEMVITAAEATGLSLVCLAGFITCPYLDLTFNRARQSTTATDARFAFGVGFGVYFAAMIVLTYFYAWGLPRTFTPLNAIPVLGSAALLLIALHWSLQMTYTVHVHAAELAAQADARDDRGTMRAGLSVWLAVALAAGLAAASPAVENAVHHGPVPAKFAAGEVGYRVFMSFYGLLFPAYVLLAVRRPRVSTVAWLVVAAVASPFYAIAFLQGRMAWASVGVAVLVAGVLTVRRFTPPAAVSPTE